MLVELVPISNCFKMVSQALHIICKVICNSLEWELQYNVVSWTRHSLLLLSQDLLQIRIRWVKYIPMTHSSKWTFSKFIIIEFILVYRIFFLLCGVLHSKASVCWVEQPLPPEMALLILWDKQGWYFQKDTGFPYLPNIWQIPGSVPMPQYLHSSYSCLAVKE